MCRLLGCLVALATANGSTATMEIAVRGKPADVVVLLAAPVSPSQAYAAQELTNYVAKMTDVLPDEVKKAYMDTIPLKRFGTAEDIAKCVAVLAGPDADYITGQIVSVNGGMIG